MWFLDSFRILYCAATLSLVATVLDLKVGSKGLGPKLAVLLGYLVILIGLRWLLHRRERYYVPLLRLLLAFLGFLLPLLTLVGGYLISGFLVLAASKLGLLGGLRKLDLGWSVGVPLLSILGLRIFIWWVSQEHDGDPCFSMVPWVGSARASGVGPIVGWSFYAAVILCGYYVALVPFLDAERAIIQQMLPAATAISVKAALVVFVTCPVLFLVASSLFNALAGHAAALGSNIDQFHEWRYTEGGTGRDLGHKPATSKEVFEHDFGYGSWEVFLEAIRLLLSAVAHCVAVGTPLILCYGVGGVLRGEGMLLGLGAYLLIRLLDRLTKAAVRESGDRHRTSTSLRW